MQHPLSLRVPSVPPSCAGGCLSGDSHTWDTLMARNSKQCCKALFLHRPLTHCTAAVLHGDSMRCFLLPTPTLAAVQGSGSLVAPSQHITMVPS